MNGARATLAIVRRRLDRRYAFEWFSRFAVLGCIGMIFAPLFSTTAALIALTLLLPLAAASEPAQADALRRPSLFALPLYGRQLARAVAVAPALRAVAAPVGFLCGLAVRQNGLRMEAWIVVLCANAVGALVALGAVFRDGARAWLYYVLTVLAAAAIVAPVALGAAGALALSLALTLLLGFAALRALGETLARYDPLPP